MRIQSIPAPEQPAAKQEAASAPGSASTPHAEPTPKAEPTPEVLDAALRGEASLISLGWSRLKQGDGAGALEVARTHGERFARGRMRLERRVIEIHALSALGRAAQARARAAQLVEDYPASAYADQLRPLLDTPR